METNNSGASYAVLHSQFNRRSVGPIETCISDPKVAVFRAKTTNEVWNPQRVVIQMLKSQF